MNKLNKVLKELPENEADLLLCELSVGSVECGKDSEIEILRYKNEILSPKYVTSFEITGSIDDDFSGISELIISHVNKTEEKPEEETEKEKKKKVKYEKLLSKTHILRYKGEGLTTFVLVEEKSYVGRAFNVAPAGIDVPTVARGTKANNTILTHRDKLFSKIRGNLHHLEQAIESLT